MEAQRNEKEVKAILALSAEKRYDYFIKRIVDNEELWSLWREKGWVLAGDGAGVEIVPVWPHSNYATLCATDEWLGCEAKSIALDQWLGKWIPGLELDNRQLAVFPIPNGKNITVTPRRLEQDILCEQSKYE